MKKRRFVFTAVMGVALAGAVTLAPAADVKAAPYSETGNGIGYTTTNDGLDIFGITDESGHVRTTYDDEGYMSAISLDGGNEILWLGDNSTFGFGTHETLGTFSNGHVYEVDGLKVSVTAGMNSTNDCVVLNYDVTNTTSSDKSIMIGTFGDTMIKNKDDNCRLSIENGRIIFKHPTEEYGFAFATDQNAFDTMYVGYYVNAHKGIFTNSTEQYNDNVDSGIAFSWSFDVPAGESVRRTAYNAVGDYQNVVTIIDTETNTPVVIVVEDWLEPLRTLLKIAADPEFGANVNNTATYTGTYALPLEFMQFIKDHPEVTLNYSFYKDDVLKTVTINGANVIVEEDVPWYGFDYLLSHYGEGASAATPADTAIALPSAYTIVSGDTLNGIASKLGYSVEALAAFNGISNVDLIYAGNTIFYY